MDSLKLTLLIIILVMMIALGIAIASYLVMVMIYLVRKLIYKRTLEHWKKIRRQESTTCHKTKK